LRIGAGGIDMGVVVMRGVPMDRRVVRRMHRVGSCKDRGVAKHEGHTSVDRR
jgi:hypothetical protein